MTSSTVRANPSPLTLRTIFDLRAEIASRREANLEPPRVGLVPTMGALHAGHLSLIARAREQCDLVVVSVFVNPTQFNDAEDLKRYPRDEAHDARLASSAGADLVFAPAVEEIYPPGFATTVVVSDVSEPLEGARRGHAHFEGVATVVAKLLNIVGPDVAYFGQKDAQQGAVIRRLVTDLNFPVEIEICPTVREAGGLALSSRNQRLTGPERARAMALSQALRLAQTLVRGGERSSPLLAARARDQLAAAGVSLEYFELVDPESFRPVPMIDDRPVLAVVAARVGKTRLIDNLLLEPGDVHNA